MSQFVRSQVETKKESKKMTFLLIQSIDVSIYSKMENIFEATVGALTSLITITTIDFTWRSWSSGNGRRLSDQVVVSLNPNILYFLDQFSDLFV